MKISFERKYKFVKKIIGFSCFIFISVIIILLLILVLSRFKPVFQDKAVILAKNRATEILNSAVIDVFSGIDSYDFVNISKKETGEITSISSDSVEMNKFKSIIMNSVSEKAKANNEFYIHIPVGSLTKYPVLQGMGYRIPIKVMLDSVTKTDFEEEFINAGINQVKNRIFIVVSARISIVSSLMTMSEVITTEIPVSETIVVGDVPDYYGEKLNVVGR